MNPLNLIRLPVNMPELNRFAESRALVRRGVLDEGLMLHHILSETFGPGTLQPFRLMVAHGQRRATLYAYTGQDADVLQKTAEVVATPDILTVLDISALAAKPLPKQAFTTGKRLGFDIKLRPVVRLHKESKEARAGAERDAFQLEASCDHPDSRGAMAKSGRTRAVVYMDWLTARLGKAATLERETTRLTSFQRVRALRGGKIIEGPEAILHGTLRIDDPAAFSDMIRKGIGRHRSYGYGMVLLRPPQRC